MKTTADYIDALRVKLDVDSDFKAMHALGVNHRQQVSKWRKCHLSFDEELSLKVADVLEIDPAQVILDMHHQREKNEEVKAVWKRVAERMAVAAVVVMVLGAPLILSGTGNHAGANAGAGLLPVADSPVIYIMRSAGATLISTITAYWPVFLPLFALIWHFRPRHTPPRK